MVKPDLREDVRFRVLRTLQDNPNFSHKELARELGVSAGAVNYCMRALIEKGYVKVQNFRAANNRLRYAYLLTPHGMAEKSALTGRFLSRKLAEYDALCAEIEAVRDELGDASDVSSADLGTSK